MTRSKALENVVIKSLIDPKSPCAATAIITTVEYQPPREGADSIAQLMTYTGSVQLHPRLELVIRERAGRDEVVWGNADLAAIFLKQPVTLALPKLALADTEVQVGEAITLVGYGPGEASSEYGVRQSGENQVSRILSLDTGSVIFRVERQRLDDGRAASHLRGGDSGGACVKQAQPNVVVGIATIGAQQPNGGHLSIFTSIHSHRQWIDQALKVVKGAK